MSRSRDLIEGLRLKSSATGVTRRVKTPYCGALQKGKGRARRSAARGLKYRLEGRNLALSYVEVSIIVHSDKIGDRRHTSELLRHNDFIDQQAGAPPPATSPFYQTSGRSLI